MNNIYLISGLGADHRVFSHLSIKDYSIQHIHWLTPKDSESLSDYASRISSQIRDNNPIIIGVSFGGILAIEISNILNCERIIIISSAKNSSELPLYYSLAGRLKLYKFIPRFLLNKYTIIISYLFGTQTHEEDTLLKAIINDTDVIFAKWAITRILTWNRPQTNYNNLYHIHGTNDRLIPIKNIKNCINVEDGTHFMIVNKSELINSIINDLLVSGSQRPAQN